MSKHEKLIEIIGETSDITKLQNWIENAERQGAGDVADAARRRLIEVNSLASIEADDDPLVLDFWKSISALEFALTSERGKSTRLSRTRQKIARVGVQKTLADLAVQPEPSEGYHLLRDRGMLDLSAEVVILRFPSHFDDGVLSAARARLDAER